MNHLLMLRRCMLHRFGSDATGRPVSALRGILGDQLEITSRLLERWRVELRGQLGPGVARLWLWH